jgi:hypothetical protein
MVDGRKGRAAGIVAVVLLLCAAGWFAGALNAPRGDAPAVADGVPGAGPAQPGRTGASAQMGSVGVAPRGAGILAQAASGGAVPGGRPADPSRWTCSEAPRAASAPPLLAGDDAPESVRAAMRRQVARLQASAVPVDRAIGLLAADEMNARPGEDPDEPKARDARADALARLALQGGDAQAYGWALRSCIGARLRTGACAGLTSYHWARLDPGNAVPWLYVGVVARQGADAGALDEAMYRMSVADRVDDGRNAALAGLARTREPGDDGALALSVLGTHVIRTMASWPEPDDVVMQGCRPEGVASDANRRERCLAVARRFAEKGATAELSRFGDFLQARLTGDDTHARRRQAFLAALRRQRAEWGASECAEARGMASFIERSAAIGDRAAWEERMAATRDGAR